MGHRLDRRLMPNTSIGTATAPGPGGAALAAAPVAVFEASDESDAMLERFAEAFSFQRQRSPILHTPAEHHLDFEDITFPARDGVSLEGWYIPARGSDKLIIANHPMGFSRSGIPAHLEPWHSIWAPSGNGFEVDLTPDYKILHDAGYNVLAYDMRNAGHSGDANGTISSSGIFEARGVVGSLDHVRGRRDTRNMTIGLFSRCMGGSSTFAAMTRFPEEFRGVRCLVSPQPVTARIILARRLEAMGIREERIDDLDRLITLRTSINLEQRSPQEWAKNVMVPTFLYGVRNDVLTHHSDVQTMYDNIPVEEKRLHWITGTTRRWDGYLEFQRRPEPMLEWFATYMN